MKQLDVRCPACGAVNSGIYLEETGGLMECSVCGSISRTRTEYDDVRESWLSPELLADMMNGFYLERKGA